MAKALLIRRFVRAVINEAEDDSGWGEDAPATTPLRQPKFTLNGASIKFVTLDQHDRDVADPDGNTIVTIVPHNKAREDVIRQRFQDNTLQPHPYADYYEYDERVDYLLARRSNPVENESEYIAHWKGPIAGQPPRNQIPLPPDFEPDPNDGWVKGG
jgi:hypothetical protein